MIFFKNFFFVLRKCIQFHPRSLYVRRCRFFCLLKILPRNFVCGQLKREKSLIPDQNNNKNENIGLSTWCNVYDTLNSFACLQATYRTTAFSEHKKSLHAGFQQSLICCFSSFPKQAIWNDRYKFQKKLPKLTQQTLENNEINERQCTQI